jgi:curved DNA-binding protein CbpA
MTQTFYQILGLDPKAEDVVIKAAFKALAQKYHPDKAKGNKDEATQLMVRLNTAYQTLMDANSRLKYDQKLEQLNKSRNTSTQSTVKPQPSEHTNKQPSRQSNPHHAHQHESKHHHSNTHDHKGSQTHNAKSKGRFDVELIDKILSNQVDEIEMVNLFEKLYQTSLIIHHGFANTYSFIKEGQRYKHDFSSLKKVILHKLEHESKVH